jgi:hypothetical protein
MIRLGSLRRICDDLGLRIGRSVADIKKAFHQNVGAYITAKLTYRDIEGKERRLEAGFNRYGVVFTGESLPGGVSADAVYIILNESYRQVLNTAPTRPVDYDYLTLLKPLAQRFYELLSFRMYAALKYQHPQVSMRYSELCQFAPQQRYTDGAKMSKQMYKVHQPHLQSGYLAGASTESVVDDEGRPDWILHYVPGPKAQADYQVFSGGKLQDRRPDGAREGTTETLAAVPARNALLPSEHSPDNDAMAQAISLVRRFHHEMHQVSDVTLHPKEVDHAASLIDRHGQTFADFFLSFACKAARQTDFNPHVFGGLMRHEREALAAYRRQQVQRERVASDAAEAHEAHLLQVYEQERLARLTAFRDELSPDALTALEEQVREELMATEPIPRSILDARLKAELHDRLALQAEVPSYEDWLRQREETSR